MIAIDDVASGFQLEEPFVFVRWGVSENSLISILSPATPRRVRSGYYWMECVSLRGLRHMIGFHFRPLVSGKLGQLEFSRAAYPDLKASYDEFQSHLVACFGEPHHSSLSDSGFDDCLWIFGRVRLSHVVFDRFGLEERVSLECAS